VTVLEGVLQGSGNYNPPLEHRSVRRRRTQSFAFLRRTRGSSPRCEMPRCTDIAGAPAPNQSAEGDYCAFSAAAGRCDAQIMICSDKIQGLPPRLWWPHFHLIKISFDGIRIFKTFLTTWLLLYWTNQISLLRFCYIPSNVHKLYRWCGLCLVKLYQSVMMVKLVLAGVMLDDETRSVVMFFVSNLASVITMTSLNDTYIWRHVTPNNALE
jgi:hypothetical protein